GTVCVVGKMRDLILQLSKSSIYSTKPFLAKRYPASKLTIEVFEPAQDIPDGKKGIDWNDVLQLTGQDGFPIHWAPECLNQL
ncbi:hypothetical protein M7820_22905, partial [Enterobacter hormaechei subsp. xiangfangensis]|nr:hypothetical protein [Enterobacter hormaechei subsp. xiangfangensis]MCW4892047.1 hypothetical protein [Enterobacter hormaechei subsp. xiangfangensis]